MNTPARNHRHRRLLAASLCAAALGAPAARADQVGADDFRISQMGGTGDVTYRASVPATAYNSTDDEYLVVWVGDTIATGDDQWRVFGQRLDAANGAAIGIDDFVISDVISTAGSSAFLSVDIAYNATRNEYLVVWTRRDVALGEVDFEIFGRRLTAAGDPIDGADVQISHMVGTNGFEAADAVAPDVAYNPTAQEYLVVWEGDRIETFTDAEVEIFGQRLDAITGAPVGTDDFRISDAGGTDSLFFDAREPAVAYNAIDDEYLVVWTADDVDSTGIADNEFEIYGQRVSGAGAAVGNNDFRISSIGPAGNPNWNVYLPDVAYDADRNAYLVVWTGSEAVNAPFDTGDEIYAQRLDHLGAETAPELRISDVGGLAETGFDADQPAVSYHPSSGQYLVVFRADDDAGGQVDGEWEIHAQQLDAATGAEVGPNDVRLSDMATTGSPFYQAILPAIAASPANGEWLVVFQGDDNAGGLVDNEFEVFGQRYAPAALPLLWSGFEPGNLSEWSGFTP
jgi:hypothetical protein